MQGCLLFLNFILAVIILFFQRKDPRASWAWLLLLFALPGIGFLIYLFFGTDMVRQPKRQGKKYRPDLPPIKEKAMAQLVAYNYQFADACLTTGNKIKILRRGLDKFADLLEDIENAKEYILLEYYIIRHDPLFYELFSRLQEKASKGVKVFFLYDGMGCHRKVKGRLRNAKGEHFFTTDFFASLHRKPYLRLNYRNHRKIVVIDGAIGYLGGFNIGKEYLGLNKKFGNWQDTHLRMEGDAALSLAKRFVADWNMAKGKAFPPFSEAALPYDEKQEGAKIQIVAGGPYEEENTIRDNLLKMILMAKESIEIQSPYLVPDESILNALKLAVRCGVKLRIMIPCKPDHPFVYWASLSYLGELIEVGAKGYLYRNGFLHAKGIIVDDKAFLYGTANMDVRSFFLNFEVDALVLDEKEVKKMRACFEEDLLSCDVISKEEYEKRKWWFRVRERISRMVSPIL